MTNIPKSFFEKEKNPLTNPSKTWYTIGVDRARGPDTPKNAGKKEKKERSIMRWMKKKHSMRYKPKRAIITMRTEEGCIHKMYVAGRSVGRARVDLSAEQGEDPWAYCELLYIEPDMRGQGLGTELLRWMAARYGSVVVAPDNRGAQRLYKRLGSEAYGREAYYYIDQGFGVYEIM